MMIDVPRAKRIARPSWLNLRTLAGLGLFATAVLVGGRFLEAARTTAPAWAAARDLPAGAALMPGDVRLVEVNLPDDLARRYLGGRAFPSGLVTTRAIAEATLITTEAVSDVSGGAPGRAIAVPVAPEHAVGGALRPGDRVDVFATTSGGGAAACTRVVAAGVEVLEIVEAGGIVIEEGALAGVTLAVSPEQAVAIAHAIRTADIDIVRHDAPAATAVPARICAGPVGSSPP